jgi:(1->4)-alpha-D-glucan 1-alpha-D-glucosylmutase
VDVALSDHLAQEIAQQVLALLRERQVRITATYRLQLHRNFNFHDAAALVPYLHDLGISHVYCSPYLRARAGSQHGYDLCDHTQFNPELGGEAGYRQFVAALAAHDMGHILDIVPNHMAASLENPWWVDVLENGPASPYSHYFDIDWNPVKQELTGKVLLPVLGKQYGEALEEGELQLEFREGAFFLRHGNQSYPLGPRTTIPLLSHRLDELRGALGESSAELTELESIITALGHLPPQSARESAAIRERQREKEVVKRRLRELAGASAPIRDHLLRNVEEYRVDRARPESLDRLHNLLDGQPYRLSYWRSAADEINYRRFFDVNDLAAISMELPEVFHAAHALLRPHLADGTLAGLRIDHVDGLYDPEQYLWRLQWAYLADLGARVWQARQAIAATDGNQPAEWRTIAPDVLRICAQALHLRQPTADDLRAVLHPDPSWQPIPAASESPIAQEPGRAAGPLFVLVEKILGPDEPLPDTWPVAGTSGYHFLGTLNGLFVVPQGLGEIVRTYQRFLGVASDLREVEHRAKVLILRVAMASELQMLAHRLNRISEQHRRSRDFTLNALRLAIREVLACFPVYRVYPGKDGISERDRKFVNLAVAKARRRNSAFDPAVFEFLKSVLLLQHPPGLSPEQIAEREVFTGKFQQVTSPVMAKGVEDTAFYVHVPLLSVNEVGSDPTRAATTIAEFHAAGRHRNERWPRAMLATSTHDTKRSEDVRARLQVLTEIPQVWRTAIHRFSRLNKRFVREVDGEPAPSRNDEYLFYQSLLGIWPLAPPDDDERHVLIDRLSRYMEKATREAKQRTSWINPNQDYDAAMRDFVAQALRDSPRNRFLQGLEALHAQVAPAGQYNALAQSVLKLLSPGVPDLYQGQEIWDFSLVDPDNRRPVDYDVRKWLLGEIRSWDHLPEGERHERIVRLGRAWADPRLKLLVTTRLLNLRRQRQELFARGEYVPLEVAGPLAQHVVAFGWRRAAAAPLEVLVAVPRQMHALLAESSPSGEGPLWIDGAWTDTAVQLPDQERGPFRSLFTGQSLPLAQGSLAVSALLAEFPVAVLYQPEA